MIVVDASVAAKWVLIEEYSTEALAVYESESREGQPALAPHLLPFEVTNIIRQRMRREGRSLAEGMQLLQEFLTFPITLASPPALHLRALEIADRHDLPAAYDAHYIALAEILGCELWTDDQRLLRTLNGALPFVRWIGDFIAGNDT
ncbi:MAG: type II toxin-antitoxin system VapC family toxin [Dehalococcoidia bacterium]